MSDEDPRAIVDRHIAALVANAPPIPDEVIAIFRRAEQRQRAAELRRVLQPIDDDPGT